MMGDRVVLWSDGGRYISDKDIASAEVAQGQNLSWNLGEIFSYAPPISYLVSGGKGSRQIYRGISPDNENRLTVYSFRVYRDSRCNNADDGYFYFIDYLDGVPPYSNISLKMLAVGSCGSSSGGYGKTWEINYTDSLNTTRQLTFYQASISNVFHSNLVIGSLPVQYRLTIDDTSGRIGDFSYTSLPTNLVVSNFCYIKITFADSTKLNVRLDYCPSWVKVVPDKQCPPDTCHECEHEGLKCCYSLGQDGLFHLIDSFHV